MLNIFDWLRGRPKPGKTATELYGSIVTQARQPLFYTDYGVLDVAEKRYEMIVLHIVLVLERLRESGEEGMAIGQEIVEAFVGDLDGSIREMAVGDTKVPANVKKAAGGLLDRDLLYRQAFELDDAGELDEGGDAVSGTNPDEMTLNGLLCELLFDGKPLTEASGAPALLRYTRASRARLGQWRLDLGAAELAFADPADFLTETCHGRD